MSRSIEYLRRREVLREQIKGTLAQYGLWLPIFVSCLSLESSFHFYFHKYIQVGATGNILLSNFSGGKSFYKESYWGHHYTIALNCHHWAHGWLVILSQIVSMKKKKQINDNSHSKRKSSWRYQGIMVDNLKLTSKSRNNSPWNLIIHGSCFFFCRKLTK